MDPGRPRARRPDVRGERPGRDDHAQPARRPRTPRPRRRGTRCASSAPSLDPDVRVVVVQGAGDTFSAGLDRRMLSPEGVDGETSRDAAARHARRGDGREHRRPTRRASPGCATRRSSRVAAVPGAAVGAGFQLALACDLRVLAEDARFSMREPLLGLVPDLTGTKPLVELVGYSRALEICATARWVGGRRGARHRAGARPSSRPTSSTATVADLVGRADRADLRRGDRDQGAAAERGRRSTWRSSGWPSARRRYAGSASSPR